jgi:regulator of cell morphogenesis and NO signaling
METNRVQQAGQGLADMTLSEIVSKNYKAASVLEKYNLDFCCGGDKPAAEACEEKGLNPTKIFEEILSLENSNGNSEKYNDWSPDFLIDYIVNNHHSYVTRMIPVIAEHTQKIAGVHGKNHPELIEAAKIFERVYKDLKQHMMKEEQILFPFVKQLVRAKKSGNKSEAPYFGTVKNPIRMMEAEHEAAGDELHEIRDLTNNYNIPDDACATYKATMQELKEFEEDLHKHVYLENYILFPKSVDLEQEILKDN